MEIRMARKLAFSYPTPVKTEGMNETWLCQTLHMLT